ARRADLRQRDDAQEQLLPLQPALLHLPEHVAADRAVGSTVDAVVLLLLHGEVGPEDLLERVLLGGLAERVVGSVLHVRLVVLRLPGKLLDLLMSLGQTLPTHCISSLWVDRERSTRRGCVFRPRGLPPSAGAGAKRGWRRQRRRPESVVPAPMRGSTPRRWA